MKIPRLAFARYYCGNPRSPSLPHRGGFLASLLILHPYPTLHRYEIDSLLHVGSWGDLDQDDLAISLGEVLLMAMPLELLEL